MRLVLQGLPQDKRTVLGRVDVVTWVCQAAEICGQELCQEPTQFVVSREAAAAAVGRMKSTFLTQSARRLCSVLRLFTF